MQVGNRHPLGGATSILVVHVPRLGLATDLPVPSIAASWASTTYRGTSRDNGMNGSFMVRHAIADLLARLLQGWPVHVRQLARSFASPCLCYSARAIMSTCLIVEQHGTFL